MLSNQDSLDFKQAVYLTENAYHENQLDEKSLEAKDSKYKKAFLDAEKEYQERY